MDVHVAHALLREGNVSTRVCLLCHVCSPGEFIHGRAFAIFIGERLRGNDLKVWRQFVVIDIFREPYQRYIFVLDRVCLSQFGAVAW